MLIEVIRNSLGLLGINAFWQGTFIGGAIRFAVTFDRLANYRRSIQGGYQTLRGSCGARVSLNVASTRRTMSWAGR